jgi:GNAT superfamily N-acetyltransferase
MAADFHITNGYAPGAIGRVVEMHGRYYAAEWGFGPQFETEVAAELAAFMGRYNPAKDGFWLAWNGDRIVASVTLDHAGEDDAARVRWFVAEPELQGSGIGGALFRGLLAFAKETRQDRVYLWTFEGLTAARRIYDRAGFVLTEECLENDWGPEITAQRMEWPA